MGNVRRNILRLKKYLLTFLVDQLAESQQGKGGSIARSGNMDQANIQIHKKSQICSLTSFFLSLSFQFGPGNLIKATSIKTTSIKTKTI